MREGDQHGEAENAPAESKQLGSAPLPLLPPLLLPTPIVSSPIFLHKTALNQKLSLTKATVPGILNLGNTCFASVVLQSLAACSAFVYYVETVVDKVDNCAFAEVLLKTLKDLNAYEVIGSGSSQSGSVVDPSAVLRVCRAKSSYKSISANSYRQQQDAQEFLQLVFELLQQEQDAFIQKSGERGHSKGMLELQDIQNKKGSEGLRIKSNGQDRSLRNPFKIDIVQQKTCRACAKTSPFRISSLTVLPLPAISRFGGILMTSLNMALGEFTMSETVSAVFCQNCKANKEANRKLMLGKPPKLLCLHVQRKTYNARLGCMQKLEHLVSLPETLDLSPFCFAKHVESMGSGFSRSLKGDCKYRLVSVVEHLVSSLFHIDRT